MYYTTVIQFRVQILHCRTLSYSSARKRWDNVNESSSNSLWLSFSKILEFSQVVDYVELQGDSDVGDIVMLVTLWWWLIWDVDGKIIKSVTNISKLLPTHLVSNIRHQHRCNRTPMIGVQSRKLNCREYAWKHATES